MDISSAGIYAFALDSRLFKQQPRITRGCCVQLAKNAIHRVRRHRPVVPARCKPVHMRMRVAAVHDAKTVLVTPQAAGAGDIIRKEDRQRQFQVTGKLSQ